MNKLPRRNLIDGCLAASPLADGVSVRAVVPMSTLLDKLKAAEIHANGPVGLLPHPED
jgi:hypothetical protein